MPPYMEELLDVDELSNEDLNAAIARLEDALHEALREAAMRENSTISLTLIGHPDSSVELSRLKEVTKHKMHTNHD